MAKITRIEKEGPLREGLKMSSELLGPEYGGNVFAGGRNLANHGLDVVLDLESQHLGNSDYSIPQTTRALKVQRDRGLFSEVSEPQETNLARM